LSTNRPNLLRAWWPAAVWLGIITFESTDYMSGEHTSGMLYAVLTRLFGEIDLREFLVWHHYGRKTGHVIGYAMLCLLLYRAWRLTFGELRPWAWRTAVYAWLGTLLVASLDEWHQSYIPSRGASIRDVALDSTAGFLILLLTWLCMRRVEPSGQRA
jgi:VanZ family protein